MVQIICGARIFDGTGAEPIMADCRVSMDRE